MTEPKRRGRPPGSKNKTQTQRAIELTGIPYLEPASVESFTAGPYSINVVVIFNAGLSAATQISPTAWPQGWPIPQLNDVIRVGGMAGRVRYVEYDVDMNLIRITAV